MFIIHLQGTRSNKNAENCPNPPDLSFGVGHNWCTPRWEGGIIHLLVLIGIEYPRFNKQVMVDTSLLVRVRKQRCLSHQTLPIKLCSTLHDFSHLPMNSKRPWQWPSNLRPLLRNRQQPTPPCFWFDINLLHSSGFSRKHILLEGSCQGWEGWWIRESDLEFLHRTDKNKWINSGQGQW